MDRKEAIARIIFDWLNHTHENDSNYPSAAPYSFNEDEGTMTISVDGSLDCRALAAVIDTELEKRRT